jgi:hyperosmotically inducible protein
MMTKPNSMSLPAAGVLLAALALAGCSKHQEEPLAAASGSNTAVVSQTPASPEENSSGSNTSTTVADAKQTARDVGQDVKQAGEQASKDLRQAGSQVSDKVTDAVITTAVNAELAKDKNLSATKIDVDTAAGRVALRGTAASANARDRATQLALSVKGVVSVDNQLTVQM